MTEQQAANRAAALLDPLLLARDLVLGASRGNDAALRCWVEAEYGPTDDALCAMCTEACYAEAATGGTNTASQAFMALYKLWPFPQVLLNSVGKPWPPR